MNIRTGKLLRYLALLLALATVHAAGASASGEDYEAMGLDMKELNSQKNYQDIIDTYERYAKPENQNFLFYRELGMACLQLEILRRKTKEKTGLVQGRPLSDHRPQTRTRPPLRNHPPGHLAHLHQGLSKSALFREHVSGKGRQGKKKGRGNHPGKIQIFRYRAKNARADSRNTGSDGTRLAMITNTGKKARRTHLEISPRNFGCRGSLM